MQIHNLVQGTPAWHAHRAKYFNASDAPAMMGLSSYKTRTQLLDELASGMTEEIDARTQALFDEGHRTEALARVLAEEILGEELFPVVGTDGNLGASFDGLTMDNSINFEHKLLNDKLRVCKTADDLAAQYRIQMEQQMLISGADRTLFMATKWQGDTLVEKIELWYESDSDLRDKITNGWIQFEKDLANHKPKQLKEKPQAEAIMQLPALAIQIRGEVSLSNLPAFKKAAESFIAEIKTELATDEDFANAEANVKFLGDTEKKLDAAKAAALSQTVEIDELMRTIDKIQSDMRHKRLALDKLVKEKKESIKAEIVREAHGLLIEYLDKLENEIAPVRIRAVKADFAGAVKSKRTITSLHDAVDTELARCKIEADHQALKIRSNLAHLDKSAADYKFLFFDISEIAHQEPEHFAMTVQARIEAHLQAEKEKAERAPVAQPVASAPEQPSATPKRTYHPNTPKTPSRNKIIELVGNSMGVSLITAEKWLNELFSTEGAI